MSAMDRRDLRETTALALLGLMTLVGGLGHGLHALSGCTHGPSSAPPIAWVDLMASDAASGSQAVAPDESDAASRGPASCSICTLLARFRATPPAACPALDVVALVTRHVAQAAPCFDDASTESFRPRGPPDLFRAV